MDRRHRYRPRLLQGEPAALRVTITKMAFRKLRAIATPDQWKTLFAAQAGYLLDAMDILLYVFALSTLKHEFGLTNRMAGLVSSVTLISSAAGGFLCGILADRLGLTRTLHSTLLLYSLASARTA